MTTFDFVGQAMDTDNMNEIESYLDGNRDRLAEFVQFLATNSPGLSTSDLQVLDNMAQSRMVTAPSGDYASILNAANALGPTQLPRLDTVVKTIREAELIDTNADYIAACGTDGANAVLRVTGSKPSTGFVSEPATAVREKAQALLAVWQLCDDPNKKLLLFTDGFGNDPCLAARLNGIQNFAAVLSGIPPEALADPVPANEDLRKEVSRLYGVYTGPDTAAAFREWLLTNHPNVFNDPQFATVWPTIAMAYGLS
jgi:hypothetical protein